MQKRTVREFSAAERQVAVRVAAHSSRMEGQTSTTAYRRDAVEYAAGRITSRELLQRTQARYGVDDR